MAVTPAQLRPFVDERVRTKKNNLDRAYDLLSGLQPLTVNEVAAALQVNVTTATNYVKDLIADGLVAVREETPGERKVRFGLPRNSQHLITRTTPAKLYQAGDSYKDVQARTVREVVPGVIVTPSENRGGITAHKHAFGEFTQLILDELAKHPRGLRLTELATALDASSQTVYLTVRRLEKNGGVKQVSSTRKSKSGRRKLKVKVWVLTKNRQASVAIETVGRPAASGLSTNAARLLEMFTEVVEAPSARERELEAEVTALKATVAKLEAQLAEGRAVVARLFQA